MKGRAKLVAIVTFFIVCGGLLPVIAMPLPYEGLDWLSYGAAMYYGDAYEPDNSRQDANWCGTAGDSQYHNFHVSGDENWVYFEVQAGSFYTIRTQAKPMGSMADTVVELYNSSGEYVDGDDNCGHQTDPALKFQAAYTGIYYVKVRECQSRWGDAYWYLLNITEHSNIYLPIISKHHS